VFSSDPDKVYILNIYNRWGALIYRGIEWDGYVVDQVASPGVYVYFIELEKEGRSNVVAWGDVMVLE